MTFLLFERRLSTRTSFLTEQKLLRAYASNGLVCVVFVIRGRFLIVKSMRFTDDAECLSKTHTRKKWNDKCPY